MSKTLLAIAVGVVTLVAASMLGVASAEAPPTSATGRTVAVEGVATVPIGTRDSAAAATGVYREGMAKALADGQEKAALLASKAGAALDAPQSVVEDGGYIECASASSSYAEYEGEQPDFGSGPRVALPAAPESAAAAPSAPTHVNHRPKVHKHAKAKTAAATACTLTADVGVVYAIG